MLIIPVKPFSSNIPDYIIDIISESTYRKYIKKLHIEYNVPKPILISMAIMLSSNYTYVKKSELVNYYIHKNNKIEPIIEAIYMDIMSLISMIENEPIFDAYKTSGLSVNTFIKLEAFLLMTDIITKESQFFDCLSCDLNPNCHLFNNKIFKNLPYTDIDVIKLRHDNCPYSEMNKFSYKLDSLQKSSFVKLTRKELIKTAGNMKQKIDMDFVPQPDGTNKTGITSGYLGSFATEIRNLIGRLKTEKNALYIFLKTIGNNIVKTDFGKKYIDSEDNATSQREGIIESIEQINKLNKKDLVELAYIPDQFIKKIHDQEYIIKKNQAQTSGGIFILLDVSGSMSYGAYHATFLTSSLGSIASAFIAVFGERCNITNEPIYFRTFDDGVSPLETIKTKEERELFIKKIEKLSYNGGGTDIINAMKTCLKDFKNAAVDPKQSELLLISDLQGAFPPESLKIIKEMHSLGTKVRILMISTGNYSSAEAYKTLHPISDVFIQLDTSKPIKADIFDIVKPIKKNDSDEYDQ